VAERAPLGVRLAERFRGYVSTNVSLNHDQASLAGEREGATIDLALAIVSDDLDRMLAGPTHEARLEGTVTVPTLAPRALTLEEGVFTLMLADPERPGVLETRYRGLLKAEDGAVRRLAAHKLVRNDPGFDSSSDVTTVFVTIAADGGDGRELARGVATMPVADLVRSVRSLEITNARSARERLEATARFGRLCLGPMFDVYGRRG
jgi:cholesterol oxidase